MSGKYIFLCRISAIVGKRSDLRKIMKIKKKKKKNKEKTIELAPITQKVCCLENIKDFRRFVQALQKKTEITN